MYTTITAVFTALLLFVSPNLDVSDPDPTPDTQPKETVTYQIDPAHTTLGFRIRHMGIAFVEGEFDTFEGTISYNADSLAATSSNVTVQTTSIDTDVEKRDNHLRSADFFEVETYPEMTFTSTSVQPTAQNHFRLIGDLTIKGTTKEVVFDVESAGPIQTDNGQRVGFHATTTIDRRDFGIDWGSELPGGIPAVGNEVQLVLDVEALAGS
ncbi:polyisoprenoid-binding protein [Longibacter salinarum]|uniref:Polyisoprenoid-binding protein n=1 Tax=Longibacter salinarum TaxID=1850348 RepID=A0A2A8CX14_9BACT|nr:YceI family protein [Longibacter salinarum]PEN13289.1 polyisoprenoid-binding protein [Longibacter salinarum]